MGSKPLDLRDHSVVETLVWRAPASRFSNRVRDSSRRGDRWRYLNRGNANNRSERSTKPCGSSFLNIVPKLRRPRLNMRLAVSIVQALMARSQSGESPNRVRPVHQVGRVIAPLERFKRPLGKVRCQITGTVTIPPLFGTVTVTELCTKAQRVMRRLSVSMAIR